MRVHAHGRATRQAAGARAPGAQNNRDTMVAAYGDDCDSVADRPPTMGARLLFSRIFMDDGRAVLHQQLWAPLRAGAVGRFLDGGSSAAMELQSEPDG